MSPNPPSNPPQPDASGASDQARIEGLGQRLARERLRRNLSQADLAREAGVSRATVGRLENGESTQLLNLVRVLRALGLAEQLDSLAPEPRVRPLELAERAGQRRRRASPRAPLPREPSPTSHPTWTWGEDQ